MKGLVEVLNPSIDSANSCQNKGSSSSLHGRALLTSYESSGGKYFLNGVKELGIVDPNGKLFTAPHDSFAKRSLRRFHSCPRKNSPCFLFAPLVLDFLKDSRQARKEVWSGYTKAGRAKVKAKAV
ncbi:hypothetical protein Salat_0192000 [Sesamum alatum]|uniref:Uncharacterized protein n=1 Tax=Sesamum alatum TaxID=300844 RepID=A0AAE2CY07_9LAMI|nr:hypothetical protein Salat_0192000 [Sesamum alatum]